MILTVVLWVACSGEPAVDLVEPDSDGTEAAQAPSEPTAPRPAAPVPVAPPSTGNPVLTIESANLSPLYRGFFADRAAGDALARAAAPCVGDDVRVLIGYDNEARVGRMVLFVPASVDACRPVQTDTGWDLSPMTPLSIALANYRDALSGLYDMRIGSFEVHVNIASSSGNQCTVRAQGTHPPDGTGFSPCVDLDGTAHCGDLAAANPAVITFGAGDRSALRSCFIR